MSIQMCDLGASVSSRNKWDFRDDNLFWAWMVPSRTITLKCIGETANNTTWLPLITEAVEAWNNSSADTNITLVPESSGNVSTYTIEVGYYDGFIMGIPWSGETCVTDVSNGIIEGATIKINLSNVGPSNNDRKYVIAHEIGHLFGLADNPPVPLNNSVMKYNCDTDLVHAPQEYDCNNVNFIYDLGGMQ